jgi:hypothetical protein
MANIGNAEISKVRLKEQGSDPAVPAATYEQLYVKSDGLYVRDSAGNVTGPMVEVGTGATQAAAGTKGVTNGDTHDHAGGDGAQIDHGGLGGLGDDDHSQYHNDTRGDARYALIAHVTPSFVASGASHAAGHVPDPGASGGTTKYLREDATWDVPAGTGFSNPMDSAGDLIVGGLAGAPAKLDSGTSGYHLVAKGAASPAWEAQYSTLNFLIDGGGSAITTGIKGDLVVDFACSIVSWTLLADQSGAIKIDVWKDVYANFPPTDADTITNGHEPEIAASGTNAQDTDLSDWIANPPTIAAGDVLRFNVDSCTTITRATLAIKVQRS